MHIGKVYHAALLGHGNIKAITDYQLTDLKAHKLNSKESLHHLIINLKLMHYYNIIISLLCLSDSSVQWTLTEAVDC